MISPWTDDMLRLLAGAERLEELGGLGSGAAAGATGAESGEGPDPASIAAGFVLAAQEAGHLCVPLDEAGVIAAGLEDCDEARLRVILALSGEAACFAGGSGLWAEAGPDATSPFLWEVQEGRVLWYTNRQYRREIRLVDLLGRRIREANAFSLPADRVRAGTWVANSPQQDQAVEASRGRSLFVLSGGPGTGKTTTVFHMLRAAWIDGIRCVGLAAPTGRAASRLRESLVESLEDPRRGRDAAAAHPGFAEWLRSLEATTLHRYAGRGTLAGQELGDLELLVVDEASMMDVRLGNDILEGLAPEARLILVGDHRQLPSVDEGALLADLSALAESAHSPWFCRLEKSFRAADPVLAIPRLIAGGAAKEMVLEAVEGAGPLLGWMKLPSTGEGDSPGAGLAGLSGVPGADMRTLRTQVLDQFLRSGDAALLCAVKNGFWGSRTLNGEIAQRRLKDQKSRGPRGPMVGDVPALVGMPVMAGANDYGLNVFNGQRGMLQYWEREGSWMVDFGRGQVIPLEQVPDPEPSWAMTIHKSQGSEFPHVMVVLEGGSRGTTRELLYTALTRAAASWFLVASPESLASCLDNPVHRSSSMADRLRIMLSQGGPEGPRR